MSQICNLSRVNSDVFRKQFRMEDSYKNMRRTKRTTEINEATASRENANIGILLNKIQGKAFVKKNIPRALYGRFDPYVYTFNLETETVSKLIIFQ